MKNQKGITLIALVITIIVLIILAGVTIAMLTSQNGILTQANTAKSVTEKAEAVEKINLTLNAIKTKIFEKQLTTNNWVPVTDEGASEDPRYTLKTDIVDVMTLDGIDTDEQSDTPADGHYTYKFTSEDMSVGESPNVVTFKKHTLTIYYANSKNNIAKFSGSIDLTPELINWDITAAQK